MTLLMNVLHLQTSQSKFCPPLPHVKLGITSFSSAMTVEIRSICVKQVKSEVVVSRPMEHVSPETQIRVTAPVYGLD